MSEKESTTNSPKHYNFGNRHEPIDILYDWDMNFNRGSAIKYIVRAGKKHKDKEIEDLNKAIVYIQHEIKMLEAKKTEG